jgi:hypothetical protein
MKEKKVLESTSHQLLLASKTTVKASNFGLLFQKGLLSLKRVLQKNEENKICRTTLDLQI